MPYCDPCARHWTPTSMRPDGSCPSCGQVLALPQSRRPPADAAVDPTDDEAVPRAPWHFKVLLVGLAVYLAWRGVQGVGWLVHHL